jgi:hypothetical protein
MTDKILDSIIKLTNQYIIIQPNFGPKSDVKLTDKTELKAFISLLCLAALQSNKQSLEELWGTDRDGIKKFCSVMNQRHFRVSVRCILNNLELYP